MKRFKKLATGVFAAIIALNLLFIPTSTAKAYTVGRATLIVRSDRYLATAATDATGHCDVGLQIMFIDTNTGITWDNGTQTSSDNGHAECSLSSGWYTNYITYARSYHGDGSSTMALTWDPTNGYSYFY